MNYKKIWSKMCSLSRKRELNFGFVPGINSIRLSKFVNNWKSFLMKRSKLLFSMKAQMRPWKFCRQKEKNLKSIISIKIRLLLWLPNSFFKSSKTDKTRKITIYTWSLWIKYQLFKMLFFTGSLHK